MKYIITSNSLLLTLRHKATGPAEIKAAREFVRDPQPCSCRVPADPVALSFNQFAQRSAGTKQQFLLELSWRPEPTFYKINESSYRAAATG